MASYEKKRMSMPLPKMPSFIPPMLVTLVKQKKDRKDLRELLLIEQHS
ncbi:hypothetical protein RHAB15C_0000435 [Candidatus Rhabdochlamydia porcellionis]|jgi:hypothetical protein|uniref:Uncharacterized protein n=1 Tax=Candidatus Rhabdochlamydia porcellionis TaxID=225148 RepID=A0ABX8YYY0_9BACT|nr:hypothetical protein RHAB15C_0000435 [Candidatus Rhabdochlamydia porcellionis]